MTTLKDFLKKYTAVPNKFIDQYYKFYEMCENNTYGIEGSAVIKYLDLQNSRKFYERLRENYTLKSDFIIKELSKRSKKDEQRIFYFLTLIALKKYV